jgi:hypothetical protein
MSTDPTEATRRLLISMINSAPHSQEQLEELHGQVWDTDEVDEFEFHGFLAPFAVVTRKADGTKGTLVFQHHPRLYWGFEPHEEQ